MMLAREDKILSCVDPATQIGVEIGALMSPIVTPQMGQIRYVDHETTEGLRAKYAPDPNVDVNKIVDVDYVWGEHSLAELTGDEAPFDYVVASHVIEHVPDFIGWLKEIRAILKPSGILTLAIPDKRYCFDYCRQPTQPAAVIDAFIRGARKPSPREIFDFMSSCVYWNDAYTWVGEPNEQELRKIHTEAQSWQLASTSFLQDEYHDVHCWVFTPESFFSLLRTLINIGLLDFTIAQFYETVGCEFYVSLRALERTDSDGDRIRLQLESLPTFDSQPPQEHSHPSALMQPSTLEAQPQTELEELKLKLNQSASYASQLHTELEEVKSQLQQKQGSLKQLRDRLKRNRLRLQQSESEMTAIKSSKFWKLRTQWANLKKTFGA